MSSYSRLKSNSNVMHMGKKFIRLMQLNSRFCLIVSFILILIFLLLFNQLVTTTDKTHKLHKYILNIFGESPCTGSSAQHHQKDDYEMVWGNYTIELFKDQLGVTFNDDDDDKGRNIKCRYGEFLISALPGPDEENFPEILWQYFTLDALEQMTEQCDEKKRLSLKAVYTERIISHLNQIFDGLTLEAITNFPTTCYNLKHAKIIGNISPIELNKIAANTPFLLDPKAKRCKEISERFTTKRPTLRMRPDLVTKVQQQLVVAKTVAQIRASNEHERFNFVGIYITSEDKLTPEYYQEAMMFHAKNSTRKNIFVVVCDAELMIFCRDTFIHKRNPAINDVHLIRRTIYEFDFVLMSSCNSTIISNDIAILHALINEGTTVVYKPPEKVDPQYYLPWIVSETMDNWHSIGSNA